MIDSLLSFLAGLRAGAAVGRTARLRDRGQLIEACAAAREGLKLLEKPYVQRLGQEGATLAVLTIQVESLARKLQQEGASQADLQDSVTFLESFGEQPGSAIQEATVWVPRFKARLEQLRSVA